MAFLAPVAAAVATGAAAAGAAVAAAASTITLAGLAQGLMIVGTGLSLVGQLTGVKALSQIGMGMSLAGGVGGIASLALNQAGNQASRSAVSGNTAKTTKLLDVDNIDEALAANTKGVKTMEDLQTFEPGDVAMDKSINVHNEAVNNIDQNPFADPAQEQSFWQRANTTLQRYDTAANMLSGMGSAYLQTRGIQAKEDMLDKQLAYDQKQIDRQVANYGAPTVQYATPGLKRVPGIVNVRGLLQTPTNR